MKPLQYFLTESVSQLASVKVLRAYTNNDAKHPEADYHANKITLYGKFFGHPDGVQRHILFHEVGHWYRSAFVPLSDIMGWEDGEKFNNLFSAGNSEEGFAEAFAVLCTTPSDLNRYPVARDLLKSWVSASDVAYVKAWVDRTMAHLPS